ncbi:MAG: hypothetical protein JSR97_01840 [Verrucomicrobia bacterium]|nr:hypothetical protein [Verrucomicrobiota bacterium]
MKKNVLLLISIMIFLQTSAKSFTSLPTNIKNQESVLVELFKNIDKSKLKSTDSIEIVKYITEKNIEIKNYLVSTYPNEEFEKIDVNDPGTLYVGLMTAIAETNKYEPIDNLKSGSGPNTLQTFDKKALPQWASCAMEVIGGMFDIVGLYNEYVALFTSTTTTWSTVAGVVGRTLRRQFGWLAAAYLCYDIATTCF